MNTESKLIERAKRIFDNNDNLIGLWNDFCADNNCNEDIIYHNSPEQMAEMFPESIELYKALKRGSVNISHYYFRLRNDAVVTFTYLHDDNSPIDFRLLAEWLDERDEDYDL